VISKTRETYTSANSEANNPCVSSPCLNSGMCITLMDDKGVPRGYICRCTNPADSGTYCEDRNYCFSNPCMNGGTCVNGLNGYTCRCMGAWAGINCNLPLAMAPVTLSTASTPPHSQPQSPPPPPPPLKFTLPPSKFASTSTLAAAPSCFDEGRRCLNGGSCLKYDEETNYSCKCPIGYSGTRCEAYDPCAINPCLNDGTCLFKPPSFYECNCTSQYYGYQCEKLNPCSNTSCQNGGACHINYSNNDFYCLCEGNFVGKNCEQCKPQFTGDKCDKCINGFSGVNCDQLISYCSPNPCQNGMCLWDQTGYKCVCSEVMCFSVSIF
jgi:Notch 1